MVNPGTYMTWKESVIAGTTNFDTTEMDSSWADYITAVTNNVSGDVTMLTAIRNAVHNSLYAFAQSNLMNKVNESSRKVEANVWWRVAYKCVIYGATALTIIFALGYILVTVNKKKGDVSNE
jgi:hypothetical protein